MAIGHSVADFILHWNIPTGAVAPLASYKARSSCSLSKFEQSNQAIRLAIHACRDKAIANHAVAHIACDTVELNRNISGMLLCYSC